MKRTYGCWMIYFPGKKKNKENVSMFTDLTDLSVPLLSTSA